MNKNVNGNDRDGTNNHGGGRDRSPHADLQVGRLLITTPRQARLQIYDKEPEGTRGGRVIVETDGGRYGITKEVLARFPDVGSYRGYAYLCRHRPAVFRFQAEDGDEAGKPQVAIRANGNIIPLPAHAMNGLAARDGNPVAFRARPKRGSQPGAIWVDQVFPLDGGHVPLISHLILAEKLSCAGHIDVLEVFVDGAGEAARLGALERDAVTSALARLASIPSIPAHVRVPAKVALDRLNNSGRGNDSSSSGPTPPRGRGPDDPANGHGKRPGGRSEDIEESDLNLD